MGHSSVHLYAHLVFAVKKRSPLLPPEVRPLLFEEFRRITGEYFPGCTIIAVNGVSDHLHILVRFDATTPVSVYMRELKSRTSRFLNKLNIGPGRFAWQRGYGAFSCRYCDVPQLKKYIANQERHHREESFLAEYKRLLSEHGIEYETMHPLDRMV